MTKEEKSYVIDSKMKNRLDLYNRIETAPISLFASRVGCNMPELLSDMILHFGVSKNKSVRIYTDTGDFWFATHLVSYFTGENLHDVESYMNPIAYKCSKKKICETEFIKKIEELQSSKIVIESFERVENYTYFLVENEQEVKSDIVVIYQIEALFKNGSRSPKEILEYIKTVADKGTHVILVSGVDRVAEEKSVQNFEDIHNYRELAPFVDETVLMFALPNKNGITERRTIKMINSSFDIKFDRKTNRLVEYEN